MRDTEHAQVNTRQLWTLVNLTNTAYERAKNEFGDASEVAGFLAEALTSLEIAAGALERAHDLVAEVEGQ